MLLHWAELCGPEVQLPVAAGQPVAHTTGYHRSTQWRGTGILVGVHPGRPPAAKIDRIPPPARGSARMNNVPRKNIQAGVLNC
jgi:hypothetical protein